MTEHDGTPTDPTNNEPVHWYGSHWKWDSPQMGLRAAIPLLAEFAGAGVVGTDANDVYWRGASNERDWDVSGNGRRVDVKRAWLHAQGILGFGEPSTGSYDEARVDDIMLVHLEDVDVTTDHAYEPDGTVRFEMTGRPLAAYRIPVASLNALMRSTITWITITPGSRQQRRGPGSTFGMLGLEVLGPVQGGRSRVV